MVAPVGSDPEVIDIRLNAVDALIASWLRDVVDEVDSVNCYVFDIPIVAPALNNDCDTAAASRVRQNTR